VEAGKRAGSRQAAALDEIAECLESLGR
jgi:hypothetical protein